MGAHMKTTVEIAEGVLAEARQVARRRGVTLRTLIDEGLRHVVRTGRQRAAFRLRDESFGGQGLDPAFEAGGWERIRDASYSGRGA